MTQEPTVIVVDADGGQRKALFALFRAARLRVETYESAHRFLEDLLLTGPSCLVLDLHLPDMNGLELQAKLAAAGVSIPVIFLTGRGSVAAAVTALKGGAFDFLEKPIPGPMLEARVRQALDHDARDRAERVHQAETTARLALLRPGEHAVLDRMLAGLPYKLIARQLNVSYKTVEARRARIMKKLQTETLAELLYQLLTYRLAHSDRPPYGF